MSEKYTVYGADRSGQSWTCRETSDPVDVLSLLAALRRECPHAAYGVHLTDDPEAGDVEDVIEEAMAMEEEGKNDD